MTRPASVVVESSDDAIIRRLQLEDFQVSGERVIEVDLCGKATVVVPDNACPRLCKCLRSHSVRGERIRPSDPSVQNRGTVR
jgi:hypothetical protein